MNEDRLGTLNGRPNFDIQAYFASVRHGQLGSNQRPRDPPLARPRAVAVTTFIPAVGTFWFGEGISERRGSSTLAGSGSRDSTHDTAPCVVWLILSGCIASFLASGQRELRREKS